MNVSDEIRMLVKEISVIDNWPEVIDLLYMVYFSHLDKKSPIIWEEYESREETIKLRTSGLLFSKKMRESTRLEKGVEELLKILLSKKLIIGEKTSTIYKCPICDSMLLSLAIFCPYCNTRNVYPSRIAQHTVCGYTAPLIEFEENMNTCPFCGLEVRKETMLYLGKTFICNNCKRTFKSPSIKMECMNKTSLNHKNDFIFELIDLTYRHVHSYYLTEKLEKIIVEGTLYMAALEYYLMRNNIGVATTMDEISNKQNMPIELRSTNFDLVIRLTANQRVIIIDYGKREVLPYVLKKTLLERADIPYYVVSHDEEFLEQLDLQEIDPNAEKLPKMGKINGNNIGIDKLARLLSLYV